MMLKGYKQALTEKEIQMYNKHFSFTGSWGNAN